MKTPTAILCAFLAACTTLKEKITAPDGTITERETQQLDAAAFTTGLNAATAFAPKGRTVREEKSGRITAEEIKARFKP